MLLKKKINKGMSVFLAVAMLVGGTTFSANAANKAITIPTKSNYKHVSIIGNNRADTSNIIVSNSKETNNYILVNQYDGLSYALMNSANAAKTGAYILPVNKNNIPKEQQYFSASDESSINIKVSGNSSSFDQSFLNNDLGVYSSVEKNIINDISKASVDNLNKNFSNAKTVFIVNGDKGLADAMSIAPVSYRDKAPILFTTKDGNTINGYSKKSGVNYVVIGGNKVVSDSLVKKYGATRLEGRTRYETNKAVLDRYYPNRDIAYFTNGDTLVDALSSVHMTKDQGIVLVNHKKNHNLISNIDTYQIGGVEGYDFNYRDEKGRFVAVSKLKAKEKVEEKPEEEFEEEVVIDKNSTTRYEVYEHKINIDNVTGTYLPRATKNMKKLLNTVKNRERMLYMDGKEFKELYDMFSLSGSTLPVSYTIIDGNKVRLTYGLNSDEYLDSYFYKLNLYKEEVRRALSGMNLNCSNDEMIKQINRYIGKKYKYEVTDDLPIDIVVNGKGQCYHYAFLLNNMCAAVGIDLDYVEGNDLQGGPHAWNRGEFDGKMYYFDSTYSLGYDQAFMWCEENPHREIYSVLK